MFKPESDATAHACSEKPKAEHTTAVPPARHAGVVSPPPLPTQEGPRGIRFDFNDGARVFLPSGSWRVELIDNDSGDVLDAFHSNGGWVASRKKYFVAFRIKIFEHGSRQPLVDHVMELRDREVLISVMVGNIGDQVAWLSYADRFRRKYGCRLECTIQKGLQSLFAAAYPSIQFTPAQDCVEREPYATYRIGLVVGGDMNRQPIDLRLAGLHHAAAHMLGVELAEQQPNLRTSAPREILEPYVCISAKATMQGKMWNNGGGWAMVIHHLKAKGYRVLCIDQHATTGQGWVWNYLPYGAEDFTARSLEDCVSLLQHADFHIGLSSGLSWLAWATGIPVILISGFTLPSCEFSTPYRVFNPQVCHGCFNDTQLTFDQSDYFFCPRHKGTDRQFECTTTIGGHQVIGHIDRLIADHRAGTATKS